VAGPLAIVTGLFTFIPSLNETFSYLEEDNTQMAWASGLNAASGALAIAGGIALLIPGGQPVAAVFLGASAVASVVSLAVEHADAIKSFFTRPEGSYPGIKLPED
jgi:hypothetical protein